ncbi:N-acetylglucosamine-6-phosphate deacetylase [Halanaerobacter jeridensis]|uniref:N-acetylglucosamine-6-phosphate deacetylase n=1 Tax=Halanaerobacter jeridensis TaxID=706427 RepID=A0A938XUU4_9FIRM|nr:N-acetylglucosamine-6-phosphate deacetylase [Halanaerobacter jeridensis]MBM7558211.1 N-acetylglucosamine-6-phosphate deacetylase [Halanaerobacter jeridensis]
MMGIKNGKIITENKILNDKVLIFDEQVVEIVESEKIVENDVELIDAKGNYIAPGFIDLHIHGAKGYDTMDGNEEALSTISEVISKKGVTSYLPTTMTMDQESTHQALDVIKDFMSKKVKGAKVLGAHLEGPFINEEYKGAQNASYIQEPNYEFIEDYIDVVKMITLAPEVNQGYKFIEQVKNEDIVLSIGHSNAKYDEAVKAIDKGISHATHIFNAMSSFHHRKPGVVGAVFNTDITCDLIADKIHVHPDNFDLLLDIKGASKVNLITDSMRAGCMKNGIYELGGQKVTVKDGSARLDDGTLAGSILTLNKAVKNFNEYSRLEFVDVVKLVTLNPARILGIDDNKGSIKPGKDADITIFDNELDIKTTIVEGKIVYNNLK